MESLNVMQTLLLCNSPELQQFLLTAFDKELQVFLRCICHRTAVTEKVYVLIQLLLIGCLILSGMWLSAAPRMDTKRMCLKRDLPKCSKYDKYSIVNSQYDWRLIWPFNVHNNLHLYKHTRYSMSFNNHEESGDGLNLDLLTISY